MELHHSLLTAKEEKEIIARIQSGDESAQVTLLTHNERMIYGIAKMFLYNAALDVEMEDLMQEGRMALLKAAQKYSPEIAKKHKSDKFSTYATWGIRQAIKRYASRHKSGFSRSAELDEASYRVLRIQKELTDKLSRTPTYEEVAQTCNLRVSKVKAILSTPKMIRIEEGDNRNPYEDSIDNSKIEKIPDDSKSVSETVEIHEYHKYLEGLKKTHPRHAKIIKLHYGLDETGQSYSLAEIARKMKLTRERVRQIHDAAIAIMREYDEN